jgi:PRTRC genetic system protein C
MALDIKGMKRVFKCKVDGTELTLSDPNPELSPDRVMALYAAQYPSLTTATVHGPEAKNDCAVYEFKTVIGTKG